MSEGLFRRATELAFSWVKDLARGNFHKKRGKKTFVAGVARTEIENESKRRGRTPALANLGAEREATQSKSTSSLILATMQKVAGWHALISRWGNAFKARLSLSTWWSFKNWKYNCLMTQQSHCWTYTPRKPELKETRVPQCL